MQATRCFLSLKLPAQADQQTASRQRCYILEERGVLAYGFVQQIVGLQEGLQLKLGWDEITEHGAEIGVAVGGSFIQRGAILTKGMQYIHSGTDGLVLVAQARTQFERGDAR